MSSPTLYHNPRCSKSREALSLLEAHQIKPTIIQYLNQAPSVADLTELIKALGLTDAREMMRKGEAEYAVLGLDKPSLSQAALIAAMAEHPRLIERPIFIHGDRAVIGRPPERVLEIL